MSHFEETLSSTPVYDGRIFKVRNDIARLENGQEANREVVMHSGGVCVVPLDSDGCVLMVRQFRYPFGRELLEIPAGKLEPGEDHYACGMRELEEETGFTAEDYRYLGELLPTPAYDTERIHVYYAARLIPSKQHLDENEFLSVERIPFEQALQMVLDGQIKDAKTQIGLLKTAVLKSAGKL